MKKEYVTIALISTLLIVLILFGSGMFSIIGEITSQPSCSLDESNQCKINLTLPEYRKLDSYTLDLSFKSVPGDFGEPVQVSSFSSIGPLEEQYGTDYNTHWVYLYRLPSQWAVSDVYAVKFDTSSVGWVSSTRPESTIFLDFKFGMIRIPYPGNTILQCGQECDTTTNIVRTHKSSSGEPRVSIYNTFLMGKQTSFLDTDVSEYTDTGFGNRLSGESRREGTFVLEDMMTLYGIEDTSNFVLYSNMEVEQEGGKSYTSYSTTLPPTIMLSYAPKLRPTNVQISIGNEGVDTIEGQPETTTTEDLSSAVNSYCERSSSTKECVVPLTFSSSERGIITIEKENFEILAQESEESPSGFSLWGLVKQSFDFNDHPIQSYITSGILIFIVIIGIFMIPGRKRR